MRCIPEHAQYLIDTLNGAPVTVERYGYQGLDGAVLKLAHLEGRVVYAPESDEVRWFGLGNGMTEGRLKVRVNPSDPDDVIAVRRRYIPYGIEACKNALNQLADRVVADARQRLADHAAGIR